MKELDTQAVCGSLISIVFFIVFFIMYFRAITKNELIFRGGVIRGKLARVLGVIGLLGISAGAYLATGYLVFNTEPPGVMVAAFLFGMFVIMALSVRFLSIFFWHSK